jgi:hypothetical protein
MATIEELSAALVKADAAGNADDAKAFADAIRQMRGAPSSGIPGPRQDLTTGQQIYQAVRPYAAPLLEAGGAIGGGLLGATAGTFGAGPVGTVAGGVAGAGLGYGIAKEGLEMADVAMGMKAPRQGAAQVVEPVRNVLEGATFEAGGRVAGQALGYLGGKIADLRQIPQQKAAKIVKEALGPDLDQVTNALRAAQGKGVSAAQATADINSPTFQALIDRATARDPRFLRALEETQGKDAVNALAKLAGGATAAEVRGTTEAAKNALNVTTTPMREAALNRANLGKDVAAFEAQAGKLSADAAAKVADVRRLIEAGDLAEAAGRLELIKKGVPVGFTKYTYKGELAKMADDWASKAADASLDLGQGARFAQGAADALRSVGVKPLESSKIVKSIRNVANNPEFAGNDVLLGAVKNVADDISKWTGSGGIIDAKALDAIRKNSVNAAIQQLRPGMDATAQRNLAASVMSDIKPALINAIEDAGGTGYRQYLADYTKGMQAISQKKLTGEALKLWKTNKDEFVRLVQNESPETVEKILGSGKYNIATELADTTMATLQDQAKKRLTELAIKGQASAGQDALKELLLDNLSKVRLPSYITAVAATTNKALSILENKIGKKTMDILTEGLKTPEGAAKLLETLPGSERVRVLKLLSDPKSWAQKSAGATAVGVTNALAPEPDQTAFSLTTCCPDDHDGLPSLVQRRHCCGVFLWWVDAEQHHQLADAPRHGCAGDAHHLRGP